MSTDPIVAGTDGSPRAELAVDKAGELAQALGAPVQVVCAPSWLEANEWPSSISAQQVVAEAGDRLRSRGITVQAHIPEGDAALSLIAVAEHANAQMIVVGNKGMTGARRLLGSLPNRVSHQARCDVLIVPTESGSAAGSGAGSIVVGTDGSSRATQAVKRAIRLAKALDRELHIVMVSESPDSSESVLAAAAEEAAEQGVTAVTHALRGDAAAALLDVAEQNDAALLVVGSKGMRQGERDWLGNVPDKLSHAGTFSVLIAFTAGGADRGDEATSGNRASAGA